MNLRSLHAPLAGLWLLGCGYAQDRVADALDVVDLSAGLSEGFAVNVRATKLLQIGLGGYRGLAWAGLADGAFGVWQEERSEFGVGPLYTHEVFRWDTSRVLPIRFPLYGDPGFREIPWDLDHLSDRGFWDFGATLNVVFLGFNAAVSPVEFVDWLGGFAGLDLLGDDAYALSPEELARRLRSESAPERAAAIRALRRRFGISFGYPLYGAPGEFPVWQRRAVERWERFLQGRGEEEAPEAESSSTQVPDESPSVSPEDPRSPSEDRPPRPR